MTIGSQLKFIADELAPWATEIKGSITIAEDVTEMISMLITAPGSPRVIVMFDAEDKRGEYEEFGQVDRTFLVVLSRGRSLKMQDGQAILQGAAGGRPFYDLIEECREVLRALRFNPETTESVPDYKGISRVSIDGYLTDARQIRFTLGTQLPVNNQESATE